MVTFNVKARIDFYINKLNQTSGKQNLTPVFLWSCNLSQLSGMSRLWTSGHGFVVGDHGVLVNAVPAFGDRGKIGFNKLQTKTTSVKTWKRPSWEEACSYSLTTTALIEQEEQGKFLCPAKVPETRTGSLLATKTFMSCDCCYQC